MPAIKHLFLDRDGTLIVDRHYLSDPAEVELLPGVGAALRGMAAEGVDLFMITNQAGLGRGLFGPEDFQACQRRLFDLLAAEGVFFKDVRFCPHAPEDDCACRKPRGGMWEDLRRQYALDPEDCCVIGDSLVDVMFGVRAGFALSILLMTGHGRQYAGELGLPALCGRWQVEQSLDRTWLAQAADLSAAVEFVSTFAGQ